MQMPNDNEFYEKRRKDWDTLIRLGYDPKIVGRIMTEDNRRRCPKGPRGPIGPVPCDYCQHGKSLIEFGKPSDDDYLRVWIDKQGVLQVRVEAMGTVVYDTAMDNDGKELGICPMCGYMLGDEDD